MAAHPFSKARPLQVRMLGTLRGGGGVTSRMTVHCPRQQESVTLEQCSACEHCRGMLLDPRDRDPMLRCGFHPVPRKSMPAQTQPGFEPKTPLHPNETPVRAIMSGRVSAVREDLSVEALVSLLLERAISGVPVVDAEGRPVGVVTKTDLLREHDDAGDNDECVRIDAVGRQWEFGRGFHTERITRATVGEIMTPMVFSLPEDASISQAAALMSFEGVHRLPVVDSAGKVVGLVSTLDVARWLATESGYVVPGPKTGS